MSASALHVGEPERCSRVWDLNQVPIWGTAVVATFWVLLEQNGPWGRVAATESQLDPQLGAELDALCSAQGGRLALIRTIGERSAEGGRERRSGARVLIAGGLGTGEAGRTPWLGAHEATPSDLPSLLAEIDPNAATRPAILKQHPPVLAVCTNGKRDACCAMRGRPLAAAVAAQAQRAGLSPDQVWEVSHLGGHRFSPTAVLLPTGQMLGRLDARAAVSALQATNQGRLAMPGVGYERGRTHLAASAQVAEIVTRYRHHRDDPAAAAVRRDEKRGTIEVGAGHVVDVLSVTEAPAGEWPTSCGKDPEPALRWEASDE